MPGKQLLGTEELARKAAEILGDGEWHSYEDTLQTLMKVVPPGVAIRRNERDRASGQRYRSGRNTERVFPIPTSEAIRCGARGIARDFLYNKRTFETDTRYPVGRPPHGRPDRYIRMVAIPRALTVSQVTSRRHRRDAQITKLERQLAEVRAFLVEIGHEEDADRLIPKEEANE